jgi:hypothetical protein
MANQYPFRWDGKMNSLLQFTLYTEFWRHLAVCLQLQLFTHGYAVASGQGPPPDWGHDPHAWAGTKLRGNPGELL